MARHSLREGDLVAIRAAWRAGHIVGRVEDSHQGVYLIRRHVRGTATFAASVEERNDGNIEQVIHVDEDRPFSEGMERLWLLLTAWSADVAESAPQPQPLTHRPERRP